MVTGIAMLSPFCPATTLIEETPAGAATIEPAPPRRLPADAGFGEADLAACEVCGMLAIFRLAGGARIGALP